MRHNGHTITHRRLLHSQFAGYDVRHAYVPVGDRTPEILKLTDEYLQTNPGSMPALLAVIELRRESES